MPNIDQLIAYESGDLSQEDTITFFQEGIDHGWVWVLQGHYGRMASHLITEGFCTPRAEVAHG